MTVPRIKNKEENNWTQAQDRIYHSVVKAGEKCLPMVNQSTNYKTKRDQGEFQYSTITITCKMKIDTGVACAPEVK